MRIIIKIQILVFVNILIIMRSTNTRAHTHKVNSSQYIAMFYAINLHEI